MLSNPLASPYLVPVLWVVLGLLGTSLALLLIGVRGNVRRLAGSTLFRRWRVWAVIAPIYALAVMSGPVPLLILLLALTAQGLREYSALVALYAPDCLPVSACADDRVAQRIRHQCHWPERNPRNLPFRFLAIPPNSVA